MTGGTSWAAAKEKERKAQRLYAATRPKNLTPSRTYVNAAIREPYTGNNMRSARSDADQHFQCKSVQMGAQIERATA